MNNFLHSLKLKIERFMEGRYGIDQLYYAMLVCYVIFIVLNVAFSRVGFLSLIFYILSWLTLIFALIRTLSKNITQRSMENELFIKFWNKVKAKSSLNINRIKDFPEKKYVRCPHCKSDLRLPRIRGKHTVRCPRCNDRFDIRIFLGAKSQGAAKRKNNA